MESKEEEEEVISFLVLSRLLVLMFPLMLMLLLTRLMDMLPCGVVVIVGIVGVGWVDLRLLLLLLLFGSAPPKVEKTRPPFSRRVLGVIGASREEDEDRMREYLSLVLVLVMVLLLLLLGWRDEGKVFSMVVIEDEEEGVLRPT